MNTIQVRIKGVSALLMHAYPMIEIEALEKKSPEEQARFAEYRSPDDEMLYIPGTAIQRAFVAAAAFSKGKGRASLQKTVAACLMVSPERCSLGVKDYVIDSRRVVIPVTRGRVIRHRPRLDEWQCAFSIDYDDDKLTEKQVRKIVDDAGSLVGLLDFRPACKGPFGRFIVIEWK